MKGKHRIMVLQLLVLIITAIAASVIIVTSFKESYRNEAVLAFEICQNNSFDYMNNIYWENTGKEKKVCFNCTDKFEIKSQVICR